MRAPTGWGYRRIGSGAPNGNARPSCYWRRLTLPISANNLSLRCSSMPSSTLRHDPTDPQTCVDQPPSGEWNDDDFDVHADGAVVGRIFKANAAPVRRPAPA